MLVQVNVVETDKWVEVGNGTEVFFRIRDGFSEVVRDAGSRIENQLATHPVDDGAEHDATGKAGNRQFRNGVHRGDVVTLVCDDNRRLLVVEQHLVLGEVFQPAKLGDGRVHVAACVIKVIFPVGPGMLVFVIDNVGAARVD